MVHTRQTTIRKNWYHLPTNKAIDMNNTNISSNINNVAFNKVILLLKDLVLLVVYCLRLRHR